MGVLPNSVFLRGSEIISEDMGDQGLSDHCCLWDLSSDPGQVEVRADPGSVLGTILTGWGLPVLGDGSFGAACSGQDHTAQEKGHSSQGKCRSQAGLGVVEDRVSCPWRKE